MADRPLRPATDRRLGEPLPHQQANRPRAHPRPEAEATFSPAPEGSGGYPVLIRVSPGYPDAEGRLPTCYSPVRRFPPPEGGFSLDLHVLSAPPAFVLSQDQTLREEVVAPEGASFTLSLSSKSSPEGPRQGSSYPARRSGPSRSRRKRTLLSFQRPSPPDGVKKPPTRARGPMDARNCFVSDCVLRALQLSSCRDFATPPLWAAGE